MPICASCGKDNPDTARFCLACGAALDAQAPVEWSAGDFPAAERELRASIGGPGNDAPIVGDHDPVCGIPTGRSANDFLSGGDGDDELHGDNHTDSGDPAVDSGDGKDACGGGDGIDVSEFCEAIKNVP